MTPRRTRRRKWGWKSVALAVALLAAGYLSREFFRGLEKSYPPNAFYQVKRADMLISITEEGALRALNETVIRSGLEGLNRIIYLVPEGSYVQKGDLLVELDSSGLKDRLNEQELLYQERLFQMLQATGNLNIQKSLVESQIKDAELKLENAQTDFEKYRDGDAPLLIKTIEARTGVLAEQVRIATERFARTEELFKAGNASKSEFEADSLSLKREQLALAQYQEDLRLVKKYDQPNQLRLLASNVEQAKAELDRLRQRTSNEIAQAEADLKTSKAALDYLEEGLEMQRSRLANSKIVAPQNGLVVYSSVSPFQFSSYDDRRRDEGRSRFGRGGRDDGGGEFRGGRRGGRSGMDSSSGDSSRSSSSTTQAAGSGNQRLASAGSGSSATDANSSGGGTGTSGGGSPGGGGGRSGGGSGGGQNTTSAAGAFASYPSMRPASAFGGSSAATNSTAGSGSSTASSSSGSTGGNSRAEAPYSAPNQFNSRSSSMSFRDFGGFEFYGTPGMLEEGTMVRMRQELIRLPDVSKMLTEIKIEEARAAQVRPGMTAYIHVKNVPHRRFKGTVRRIAPLPDSQSSWMNPNVKVFPADILVEEELPLLKPGVSATAEIIITNLSKVLSVPIQTVARVKGESVCFVRRGSRVVPVPVTTGLFNDAFIEVTSGLHEGDFVLLAPTSDEEVEETPPEDTNVVDTTSAPRPPQQIDGPPSGEERTFQRRNGDLLETGAPTERRFPGRGEGSPETGPPTERRFQRRGDDSSEAGAPGERRRGRPGAGRRPQNSQDMPE